MDDEQLEQLGRMADLADNYLALNKLPLDNVTKVEGMKAGLEELSDYLKGLYRELSGMNPWEN